MRLLMLIFKYVAPEPPRPGIDPKRGHAEFLLDRLVLGRFSLSNFTSPVTSHSTSCSKSIIHHIIHAI
jgi:hypothetical protein